MITPGTGLHKWICQSAGIVATHCDRDDIIMHTNSSIGSGSGSGLGWSVEHVPAVRRPTVVFNAMLELECAYLFRARDQDLFEMAV